MAATLYPPSLTIPLYAIFTALGLMLTCLRFWVRVSYSPRPHNGRNLYLDDLFIVLGLLVTCTCTGIQFHNAIDGASGEVVTGGHVSPEIAIVEHKVDFTMIVIEKLSFGAVKLSLLFFYRRLFGTFASFKRTNNVLIWLVALWTVSFFLADLLLCGAHPELLWALDQTLARDGCGDKGALLIAFAATSVVTDGAVLVLPLLYLRKLRLRHSEMVAVSVIFLLGGISTVAGVLRTIFLCVAYPLGRITFGWVAPPYTETPLILRVFNPTFFAMLEMLLGIWAANLPVISPLVFFRKVGV
ncbi:hypothetical protein P171DRAFT_447006 [Karstenula rhodostoma CBS 690.94]|uniref:Rhodopsin domain-containing protein n=1 Tax=Karstenula rhodostoma CBS 690.94 TaxID=1392251 RepID=A0A9P4U7E4_9PLEO|nr:hypothetical protein P171DRAFT_447006 [Karstenula rhodostoma CBS 690.94]